MKKFHALFILCAVTISCKSAEKYKVYKADLPFPLYSITVHWSGDKYIIDEMDIIITSGSIENKGNYYLLTDDFSQETNLVRIKDEYFIFLNGRFKDFILIENLKAEKEEDFESEEERFFEITKFDINIYEQRLASITSKSVHDITGKTFSSYSKDIKLEFVDDSTYTYSYKEFPMESGLYIQKGGVIHLQGFSNKDERFDLNEEERQAVESLPVTEFISFIEDEKTIRLGTLPCSRLSDQVYQVKDNHIFH